MSTAPTSTMAPPGDRVVRPSAAGPVLRLDGLTTHFRTRKGVVRAVEDVSYSVDAGETLCVVGESGCGKSVTALSVLRLIPDPPGRIVGGHVWFDGEDLTRLSRRAIRRIRGNRISMIFQEPMSSLNPVMTVGRQIAEPLIYHQGLSAAAARERAAEMLRLVHIPDGERWLDGYPHQMSGGMRQRVMIAIALACNPAVLLADEPTTALDVTIQAQILRLMRELQTRLGTAVVLITHDLGVVAEIADRVVVMYAGRKVEEATVTELFARPLHPYTRGLMAAVPRLDDAANDIRQHRPRLTEITGIVPALDDLPPGCAFADRCGLVTDRCRRERPPLAEKAPGHWAACWETEVAHAG